MTRRTSSNVPVGGDILAREARERALRAAVERDATLAIEAIDMWAELDGAGYRLVQLADDDGVKAHGIRVRARREGTCSDCGRAHAMECGRR